MFLPSPHRISGAHPEGPSSLWSPLFPRPFYTDCSVWLGGQLLEESWLLQTSSIEEHCALGNIQCSRICVAFPRSVPWHNPVSELCRQFFRLQGLIFALICIVSCETLYRKVCAFPNPVQSIEFTTGGLQSTSHDDQEKWEAPELNFKCDSKGSDYLCVTADSHYMRWNALIRQG